MSARSWDMRCAISRRTKKRRLPTVVARVSIARHLNRSTRAAFASAHHTSSEPQYSSNTLAIFQYGGSFLDPDIAVGALRLLCLVVLRAFELSVIRVSKGNRHGYLTDRIRGGGEFD